MDSRQLREGIIAITRAEDPRNPLTDEEIARRLGVPRSTVTGERLRLGLASSRERRRMLLEHEMREASSQSPKLSTRELARRLESKGFRVSHTSLSRWSNSPGFRENVAVASEQKDMPVAKVISEPGKGSAFSHLVGWQGSLKPIIQLAQAAIMYPPRGLNTLILGPTGVGKSEIAVCMYRYAIEIGVLPPGAPFVTMNCADYADNPQLLLSYLFGHVKGAFTGADSDKKGLVEAANGGILFLDEIHRLAAQGQEMLFTLIDKGVYRRLGETSGERHSSFLLIGATTLDPDVSLLETFRRRIPVVIEVPPLSMRPKTERVEMIKSFLAQESEKIGAPVSVEPAVIRAFLEYDCPGNVGQLRADIQVACARAYLRYVNNRHEGVRLCPQDLPPYVLQGLLKKLGDRGRTTRAMISSISSPMKISPSGVTREDLYTDVYSFPGNVYEWIESRSRELLEANVESEAASRIIAHELEQMVSSHLRYVSERAGTLKTLELSGMVESYVLEAVKAALSREVGPDIVVDESLIACLAIHISACLQRIESGRLPDTPKVTSIAHEHPLEFSVAKRILEAVNKEISLRRPLSPYLPEDEAVLIAMYLISRKQCLKNPQVSIVLMSHGKVATAIKDIVDRLLPGADISAFEMDLQEEPYEAFQRAKKLIASRDKGKGVLVVSDMGSLLDFGHLVSSVTGVKTGTVTPLSTPIVLEASRRAMAGFSLDEIVDGIARDMDSLAGWHKTDEAEPKESSIRTIERSTVPRSISHVRPVILLPCVTGRGVAQKLKETLEKIYPPILELAELTPCSVRSARDIANDAGRARVVAAIGPVDPGISGIPFISARDFLTPGGQLRLRVQIERVLHPVRLSLKDLVEPDLVFLDEDIESSPGVAAYDDVIRRLAKPLEVRELVGKNFVDSCLTRESWDPTVLGNGIAIPHGVPEEVCVPKIVCARLKKECNWAGYEVRLVFLMALTENCADALENLLKKLEHGTVRNQLLTVETKESFLRVLLDTAKMAETV